jgi:hypothetical protein
MNEDVKNEFITESYQLSCTSSKSAAAQQMEATGFRNIRHQYLRRKVAIFLRNFVKKMATLRRRYCPK